MAKSVFLMALRQLNVVVASVALLVALLPVRHCSATDGSINAQAKAIPMVYRVPCGSTQAGWLKPDCDGRTQYCDDTSVLKCGSCERICQPNQSTFQCQKSCKMYLDFNEQAVRDSYWIKELESMNNSREIERKEMRDQFDQQSSRSNMRSVGLLVCGGLLLAILFMLMYVVRTIKRATRYTHFSHPTSKESLLKADDQESGIVIEGGNTPASERRIEVAAGIQAENGTELRAEDRTEIQTGAETPRPWNFFSHPTDASREDQA